MSGVNPCVRDEIPTQFKWNAESVYPTIAEWEAQVSQILEQLGEITAYKGTLAENPQHLAEALTAREELSARAMKAFMFAVVQYYVDTSDPQGGRLYGKAQMMAGQSTAAVSFFEPEILALGQDTIARWMDEEPSLQPFEHYFHNLFRQAQHIRSSEVEELLGMLADPFASTGMTASMLTDSDFSYKPAVNSQGQELAVSDAALEKILAGPDRTARQTAWESYTDTYLAFKNTLANNLITSMKQNVFLMRARGHESTLAASLHDNNIPVEVFHNLIATFRANLPTWHRYWAVRRKALGVDTLQPYDIWAPMTQNPPQIPYEQAVDWICAGLAPLGDEYVQTVRQGCLENRWVDVYPNKGKTSGAFSYGAQGTFPFIVMNFDDTIFSLSTLAHELGHSMHSFLTWKSQPPIYSRYSLFVAEVASNFHQAMVRGHLLKTTSEADLQISLIEEAMANFHRYFFIMPTLARFELETHQRLERGEGLGADDMISLMADLFDEGYGGEMHVDRERVGITWATFSHLYTDYYVYQYATGISGANALASRILENENGAVERYLDFLRAGGSLYPLDVLKRAGVDLTTPEPVERTFSVLASLVDRLEKLV